MLAADARVRLAGFFTCDVKICDLLFPV